MVLATLAPGVARALSFGRGDAAPWSVVCSAAGSAERNGDSAPAVAHGLDSCAFCVVHAGALGLPPDAGLGITAPALAHAVPLLFLQAPHRLFAWTPAQARAPPAAV
jgi:hypothetical protein